MRRDRSEIEAHIRYRFPDLDDRTLALAVDAYIEREDRMREHEWIAAHRARFAAISGAS